MKQITIRILVVDDEPIICEMLKSILTSIGHKVSIANNGLEALHILTENDFDMVLMDVNMPVMSGITATRFLRHCEQEKRLSTTENHALAQSLQSRRKGTRIPVVALTGNLGDRENVTLAGMDKHISKPFKLDDLFEVIDQFCGNSTENASLERRRHLRHTIKDDTILVCNGNTGQLIDISTSGLAIKFACHELIPNEWIATLLNKTRKTSIPCLPLKLVRKGDMFSSTTAETEQTIGAIFDNPDAGQKNQINQLINSLS